MSDNRKNPAEGRGIGVGYVTLIMLFAVICLTVLASLSYQAARANDKLNEKSISFAAAYYGADSRAKQTLAQLDEWAVVSYESGFFDDTFSALCAENQDLAVRKLPKGFEISFNEKISDNLKLSAAVVFFDIPENGQRYRIDEWKTVTVSSADGEEALGVWDGSVLG